MQKMIARLIGEDIELKTILHENLGAVKVDRGQYEQILENLVINARDAMPDRGMLVIETANIDLDPGYCVAHPDIQPGPHVMLTVNDTGHGMSEEVKNHLFEPFFTAKPKRRGTGLGLATIYGAVKQSGGGIEVYSEVGTGTVFKIYLPRVEQVPEQNKEQDHKIPETLGGRETILLVEDEKIVRELAIRILKRLGYKVPHASDGEQAILCAREYNDEIQLLITDVVMPGMTGRQLAERLIKIHPEMQILFTSGYANDALAKHGVIGEYINFIGKPYSPNDLARKMRELRG